MDQLAKGSYGYGYHWEPVCSKPKCNVRSLELASAGRATCTCGTCGARIEFLLDDLSGEANRLVWIKITGGEKKQTREERRKKDDV